MIMLNNLPQMHLKLLKKAIKKIAETTGELIGNKIASKITKVSRNSPQNTSVQSETEIPRERKHIYLQKKDRKLLMT